MATDTFTISLTGASSVKITDYGAGDKNDSQYVTLTDSGNLSTINLSGFGISAATQTGEGPGGDDEVHLDMSGFNDNFNITLKSVDAGDTVFVTKAQSWSNVGNVYTINYIGSDQAVHTLVVDLNSTNGTGVAGIVITCFGEGTQIDTDRGLRDVADLAVGDVVVCGDGKNRPIRWMAKRQVTEREMNARPEFRPVRIRKGALSAGVPASDLIVSQQHRVLISDWRAEIYFGAESVLVPAVFLLNDMDITLDRTEKSVTYYHFMFDSHQTVFSNGLETESFYPGDQAVGAVNFAARNELLSLFPELQAHNSDFGRICKPTLKSYEAVVLN